MTTSFVQSALYQIVNGRLMEKRSTIISTNLAPEEIGSRYGRSPVPSGGDANPTLRRGHPASRSGAAVI